MTLRCGIVGLPNVGKSSLFNALTSAAAAAENYPFCTIEPNIGEVPLADARLDLLATQEGSAKVVPASLRLVDIAGLVAGASTGEGLGNKFLAHIREVDGIIHVVRCFMDDDVAHVAGVVDPVADAHIIELELGLADLATLERARERQIRRARSGDKDAQAYVAILEAATAAVDAGRPVRALELTDIQRQQLAELFLLTAKPVLYCANLSDTEVPATSEAYAAVSAHAQSQGAGALAISARFEADLIDLEAQERIELLATLGQDESGLERLVHAAYALLGLETFFTVGPQEARAWEFKRGTTAAQAAGLIHTDMQRGFIRAETISHKDFLHYGGTAGCREAGKLRLEGRDYVVQDGDVLHIRFNV